MKLPRQLREFIDELLTEGAITVLDADDIARAYLRGLYPNEPLHLHWATLASMIRHHIREHSKP